MIRGRARWHESLQPVQVKPAGQGAPCPPAVRERLQAIRAQAAALALQSGELLRRAGLA